MKHVSSGLRVGLAMAFCTAFLAPSALADNGKKPEDGPGNSANAPGHNKDGDAASPQVSSPETRPSDTPPPSASTEGGPAPSEAPPAEAKGQEPPAPAVAPPPQAPKPVDRERPERPEKPMKPEAKPRPVGGGQPSAAGKPAGESAAHRKVLICHATGSATNPFVVISVSVNAWTGGHGHAGHADDVFVDWSWPGDPRQKDDALCPSSGGPAAPPTSTTSTVAPTTVPAPSAAGGPDASVGRAVDPPSAAGETPPKEVGPNFAPPASAVHRAVAATSGQLASTAVRGTLPFTGMPVWAAALIGLALVALGLVFRRRTALRAA